METTAISGSCIQRTNTIHFSPDKSRLFIEGFICQVIYSQIGHTEVYRDTLRPGRLSYIGHPNKAESIQDAVNLNIERLFKGISQFTSQYIDLYNLYPNNRSVLVPAGLLKE